MSGLILVPVAPGVDTSIPTGPQVSAKYTLTGPDGTRAVFNDQTDRDYVGMVQQITGLDSPDVRESADDLVQMDGGIHGDFFYGRRPITLNGIILNPGSADNRNRRMTKLMRASNAMRQDATLAWILEGGYEQFVSVRRQQPLRIIGAWQKEFQLAVVAADPRIYGAELKTEQVAAVGGSIGGLSSPMTSPLTSNAGVAGQMNVENRGNTGTAPLITIYGPCVNPVIVNFTTGEEIALVYTLSANEFLVLDTLNRTVLLNNTASRYGAVDFARTSWFWIEPGLNDLRFSPSSASAGSSMVVQWRDAWL